MRGEGGRTVSTWSIGFDEALFPRGVRLDIVFQSDGLGALRLEGRGITGAVPTFDSIRPVVLIIWRYALRDEMLRTVSTCDPNGCARSVTRCLRARGVLTYLIRCDATLRIYGVGNDGRLLTYWKVR